MSVRNKIDDTLAWLADKMTGEWWKSPFGWLLVGFDVLLTYILVVLIIFNIGDGTAGGSVAGGVSATYAATFGMGLTPEIYVLAVFGALGYVYSVLFTQECGTKELFMANLRIPGSAVSATAVVLFTELVAVDVPEGGSVGPLFLAFLAGFSTNRVFERLRNLSKRIFNSTDA